MRHETARKKIRAISLPAVSKKFAFIYKANKQKKELHV